MSAPQPPQNVDLIERQIQAQHHMWQLRWQARARVLAALAPAHRQLVARLIGQLAAASDPNVTAAADALDRALSQNEKDSVLSTSAWLRQQARGVAGQESTMQMPSRARRAMAPADPGMTVLVLMTSSLALRTSLEARGKKSP